MTVLKNNQRKRVKGAVDIDKYLQEQNNRTYIGGTPIKKMKYRNDEEAN